MLSNEWTKSSLIRQERSDYAFATDLATKEHNGSSKRSSGNEAGKYDIVIINSKIEQCQQKDGNKRLLKLSCLVLGSTFSTPSYASFAVLNLLCKEAAMKEFHTLSDKLDRFNKRSCPLSLERRAVCSSALAVCSIQ